MATSASSASGKLAEFALNDGYPFDDIRVSEHVQKLILNGRLYDAETLNQLAPDPAVRAPLFFESKPGLGAPHGAAGHGSDD